MNISKRLRAIGDLVSNNSFILDVGCDHALLDIYVVKTKENVKAIASDINDGPLKGARYNVEKYNLLDRISLKKANGLDSFEDGVDTVILSGLGSNTIISIIENGLDKIGFCKVIVSSNNDYYYLRKSMFKFGYVSTFERVIKDKNKFYPIIVFEKGNSKYIKYEFKYGKYMNDSVYREYLIWNREKLFKIYSSLGIRYFYKKMCLRNEIRYLDRVISK